MSLISAWSISLDSNFKVCQVDLIWQDSACKIANIIIIIVDEAYVTISTAVCNAI
jgi:hypothetical protein